MARWVMAIDLDKCVGCQTCTVACKVGHGLGPGLQRVVVVEKELGEYPHAKRMYVPKRCMNCAEPRCVDACPSGATQQRPDGIVIIEQDQCVGCRYCMMACPYDARRFYAAELTYHEQPSVWEERRYKEHTVGVVDKCDFCRARIDEGLQNNLKPGTDPDATPRCVVACIAGALHFGDLEDPESDVSRLIRSRSAVQLLPEMETDPSVYYLPRRI